MLDVGQRDPLDEDGEAGDLRGVTDAEGARHEISSGSGSPSE
jgi:hypothetical protein